MSTTICRWKRVGVRLRGRWRVVCVACGRRRDGRGSSHLRMDLRRGEAAVRMQIWETKDDDEPAMLIKWPLASRERAVS